MKATFAIAILTAGLFLPSEPQLQAAAAEPAAIPQVRPELKKIMLAINGKNVAKLGNLTTADLEAELKAFDTLLANHKGQKTDELAQVALVKAMTYGKLLNDKAAAKAIEKKLKKEFEGTTFVSRLEREEGNEAEDEGQESLEIGLPFFPDFYAAAIDGAPLSVTRFKGKVVLVNCWAAWCTPAVEELPALIRLYQQHHAAGLAVIGINLDSDREKFDEFLRNHPEMRWPQYYDGLGWGNKISSNYGIRNMPYSILVNAEGDVVAKGLRGKDLADAVEKLLPKPTKEP